MKSKCLALLLFAASCVHAQSSVTIDGWFDLGMIKTSGNSAKLDATNGANQLRFLGSEDLGGGLRANFVAAMRFSPESGGFDGSKNGRPLFQGESTVGLSGGLGLVKIGRAITALQGAVNLGDPWGTWTVGSVAMVAISADPTADAKYDFGGLGRTDGVFYYSPSIGGFSGAVTLGSRNSAASGAAVEHAKNFTSLWLSYGQGPVYVGGGTEENRLGDRTSAIVGTYDVGPVKFGGAYAALDRASIAGKKGSDAYLSASVPVGVFNFMLGYRIAKAEGSGSETKKVGLGARYHLSKRTHLYTNYGRTTNSTRVNAYDVGIRTTF